MKYRPDESTLISWMFGDLDEAERAKVDSWLAENPEEMKRLRAMQFASETLSRVQDKEVIAPPLIMDDSPRVLPLWRSTWFRSVVSIAASFLLILVAGRLLGPDISYMNGELKISFNGAKQPVQAPVENGITASEVQAMIDSSVRGSEERIDQQLIATQAKVNEAVSRAVRSPRNAEMDTLARQLSRASQEQIRTFVAGLREENLQMMRQYLQLSASEQRTYMENLLVDFSKWQQEQRNQDMLLVQARVNSVEQNTNQLKQETEQILASLISNGTVPEKNSN